MNNRLIHIILPVVATLFFVAIIGFLMFEGVTPQISSYKDIIEGWNVPFIENTFWGILLNGAIVILTAIWLTKMSSLFQLIKENTLLPLLFFLLMQALFPCLVNQFEPINGISLIVFILVGILYTCYQQTHATEKGFIMALIISAVSFVDAHILYILPLLVVGLLQMQAATLRTFAAMFVGLLTPYWIVCGLGIVELSQLDFTTLAIPLQIPSVGLEMIPVGVVLLMGFMTGVGNLYSAFNEKIYTRATNGFINLLSTYTALLLIIDNAHYMQYIPTLIGCVALQASYFFSAHTKRASTITLITLVVLLSAWIGWMYWGNYPFF